MSAAVFPFPIARRLDFVLRNAARIADARPRAAEKLLEHAIKIQVETMTRRGIAPSLIAREAKAFEGAVRAELWRRAMPGDTA